MKICDPVAFFGAPSREQRSLEMKASPLQNVRFARHMCSSRPATGEISGNAEAISHALRNRVA
jgi:hypothetical protein